MRWCIPYAIGLQIRPIAGPIKSLRASSVPTIRSTIGPVGPNLCFV
jgi:hypothetical protein